MEKKQPSIEDAIKQIDLSLEDADQLKRQGFNKLIELQRLKQTGLVVEKNRLSTKYGAEHPRVQIVKAKLEFNLNFIKEIHIEKVKAEVQSPKVRKDAWMVHGRVLNEEYKGIKKITVSLFNNSKKWIKELNFSCTDERGYFAITYPAKEGKKSIISESQELFLTITNAENQILEKETDPLFVKIGKIDYREIFLSAQGETCVPPEPEKNEPIFDREPSDRLWVVHGTVTDENNTPINGLTVSLFDEDLFFDDYLGTTITDKDGKFKLSYESKDFRDLFEQKPDLYLKILDPTGKVIYSKKDKIRFDAGKEEVFQIKIEKKD